MAVFWTALVFPVAILALIVTLNPAASVWVARNIWSPPLLWAAGARLEVLGQEHADPLRATIYVSNHLSAIDIPAHFMAVRVPFRYVAKHQLRWVPFIGWYLWAAGHVFINRSQRTSALASLEKAAKKVRGGTPIFLYPEGTRSHGPVLPFKKGPFALALKAGVPICPVTIVGTDQVMPKGRFHITPGTVKVRIGAPIDTQRFAPDDREGLARAVREVIIRQSLELGGAGGSIEDALARPGHEGMLPHKA